MKPNFYSLRLRISEVRHLIHLLEQNEREGSYSGSTTQYDNRAKDIKLKLNLILCKTGNYKPKVLEVKD